MCRAGSQNLALNRRHLLALGKSRWICYVQTTAPAAVMIVFIASHTCYGLTVLFQSASIEYLALKVRIMANETSEVIRA